MTKSISIKACLAAAAIPLMMLGSTAHAYDFLIEEETFLTVAPGETKSAVARCNGDSSVVGGVYNLNPILAGNGNATALATGSLDVVRTNVDQANNRYSISLRLSKDAQGPVSGAVKVSANCGFTSFIPGDFENGQFFEVVQSNTVTIAPGSSETIVARCSDVGSTDSFLLGGTYNLNGILTGGGNNNALAQGSVDTARTNIDEGIDRYSTTVRVSADALAPVSGVVTVTALCLDSFLLF